MAAWRNGLTAALVLLGALAAARAADPADWKEPATGVMFPVVRTAPGATAALSLAGGGVRTKLIFQVYALGLYVEPAAARKELAAWKGKDADALRKDEALYRALAEGSAEKCVVMRFVRHVSAEQITEALDAAAARKVPSTDPSRAALRALLKEDLDKGDELVLHFATDGTLSVARKGAVVGSVASQPLCHALLGAWLGPDPVSGAIRSGSVIHIPALLAGE